MNDRRIHCVLALRVGLAAFVSLLAIAVGAQAFPAKSIRIIAPFPAASVADVLARPIAQKMNETWGQPVIVDNRTGAAGSLGADVAAKAPPDGYSCCSVPLARTQSTPRFIARCPTRCARTSRRSR